MSPMHRPSARHKSIAVVIAVVARPNIYVRPARHWSICGIVRRRIAVVVIIVVVATGRRVIRGWISITGVIRSHVMSLCTSAQKSFDDACAKDRQQQCSTVTLGFHCRVHQISPFLNSEFPFWCRGAARATLLPVVHQAQRQFLSVEPFTVQFAPRPSIGCVLGSDKDVLSPLMRAH